MRTESVRRTICVIGSTDASLRPGLFGIQPGGILCKNEMERIHLWANHGEVFSPADGDYPNCCISPAISISIRLSTIQPSRTTSMTMPHTFTAFPVAGIPKNSP
jgi:hypothetical protein